MPSLRSPSILLVLSCLTTLAGCASAPPPATGQCPPAAPAMAAVPAATPVVAQPAPARPQESLLEHVPGDAAMAAVVRRGSFETLRALIDSMPAFRVETGEYLLREWGIDLTGVEGVAAYIIDPKTTSAAFLRVAGPLRSGAPKGVAETYSGVAIIKLDPDVFAAVLAGGIAIGTLSGVRVAVDVAQGRRPPVRASDGSLGRALVASDSADIDGMLWLDVARLPSSSAGERAVLNDSGVTGATLQYRRDGLITLRVEGNREKLGALIPIYTMAVGAGMAELRREKDAALAGHDVAKAIGTLFAFHGADEVAREIAPRLEGNALVSSYRIPQMNSGTSLAMWIGIGAAIAIPSFQKYVSRSKSAEATTSLRRISSAAVAYHEENAARGRRFSFPASTPWAPEESCCAYGGTCPGEEGRFDNPTWKALRFDLVDGHRFQYRFVSTGKGPTARFTVEARADLKCDGTFTTFRQSGKVSGGNTVELGEIEEDGQP